jgi:hypothetical protein
MAKIADRGTYGRAYPVCEKCGCDGVQRDATVTYDREQQRWVVDDLQDGSWCGHCADETAWHWVHTEPGDQRYHTKLQHIDCACGKVELTDTQKERLAVLMLIDEGTGVEGVGVRLSETAFIIDVDPAVPPVSGECVSARSDKEEPCIS